jgi:hypothetical protein
MPQKLIIMPQNLFFDLNIKPRIGRLTLEDLITLTSENMVVGVREGEHEDPCQRPMPETYAHHLQPARSDPRPAAPWVFVSASLSLSLASLCLSLSQLYLSVAGQDELFVLPSLLPSSLLCSSFFLRLNEKNLMFLVYISFLQFFCFI